MKASKRGLAGALLGAALALALAAPAQTPQEQPTQEQPPKDVQKPSYDYMSNFLSRSTKPLGLKEEPAVRRMLNQGPVAWAIRAGSRHVLD